MFVKNLNFRQKYFVQKFNFDQKIEIVAKKWKIS